MKSKMMTEQELAMITRPRMRRERNPEYFDDLVVLYCQLRRLNPARLDKYRQVRS